MRKWIVDLAAIKAGFAERGVVRLDGAFGAEDAARIQDAVWRYATRKLDVRMGDPSTWPNGWLPISWKGLKKHAAFDALTNSPAVTTALDVIFGAGGWRPPRPGAQILFHLPQPGPWTLPDNWHMDTSLEEATWPVPAVKLFAFFGEVGPCGGGTMLLPGSHRLIDQYRSTLAAPTGGDKETWQAFLRRHPPLGQLLQGAGMPDHGRSIVGNRYEVDDVPIDVIELTGHPGDVVITHLHVFTPSARTPPPPHGRCSAKSSRPPDGT